VNHSPNLIPPNSKWKFINLNPSAPTIKGLIKLHKPDQPIRPVVNWRNAPAYKLSKSFTHNFNRLAPLPNAFNITNSSDPINQLRQTPFTPSTSLASLDISNMYSNIPVTETKKILDDVTHNNLVDTDTRKELLSWYDTITKQNYFRHKETHNHPEKRPRNGRPVLQHPFRNFPTTRRTFSPPQFNTKTQDHNYLRYVDDILLIYDSTQTNIQAILEDFNSIHPNLTFTGETEHENMLSFLDITIHKTPRNIKISIYRKPTSTDTIIPYTSNHSPQHKYSAIRFLYNRLNSYHLEKHE